MAPDQVMGSDVNGLHGRTNVSVSEHDWSGHGKQTIDEYTESQAIIEELRTIGVDYAEGYGITKPMLLG